MKPKIPIKSKIAEAFHYFLNEYDALIGYLQDGRLEIDNGFTELPKATCIEDYERLANIILSPELTA